MSAWLHLFRKEFRLGLPAMLFTILMYIVVLMTSSFFSFKSGHVIDAMFVVSLVFIFPHFFYLAFYLFISLQSERKKLHLWLSNPMPGYQLILAKMASGFVAMTISLFIVCAVCYITYFVLGTKIPIQDWLSYTDVVKIGSFFILHIYLIAISIAVWLLFFWMIYRLLASRLGIWVSVILTLILFGLWSYIISKLQSTVLYTILTHWGKISLVPFINNLDISTRHGIQIAPLTNSSYIFLGTYIFEALICLILFFVSCWILDKKIEV